MKLSLFKTLIRYILFVLFVLITGILNFSFFFADYGPGESPIHRIITIAVFNFSTGLIIGFLNPKRWKLALLVPWSVYILFPLNFFTSLDRPNDLLQSFFLLGPILMALLGGYSGKYFKRHLHLSPGS